MQSYKKDFIDFMIECDVLKFGSFTLKSGRQSPFFMNAGAYVTGSQLLRLGEFYAQAIHHNFGDDFDVLFGPSYKGIPLAVTTAIAYSKLYGKEIKYCSDRKEAKDHGSDKGKFLGHKITDGERIIIIEDVTTSGKSIEEIYPKIKAQETVAGSIKIIGEIVSLDRQEKSGESEKAALTVISEKYGFPARAIVTMQEVIKVLYNDVDADAGDNNTNNVVSDFVAAGGTTNTDNTTNAGDASAYDVATPSPHNTTAYDATKARSAKVLITDEIKHEIDAYYAKYGTSNFNASNLPL